jgi:hypothetical protein
MEIQEWPHVGESYSVQPHILIAEKLSCEAQTSDFLEVFGTPLTSLSFVSTSRAVGKSPGASYTSFGDVVNVVEEGIAL